MFGQFGREWERETRICARRCKAETTRNSRLSSSREPGTSRSKDSRCTLHAAQDQLNPLLPLMGTTMGQLENTETQERERERDRKWEGMPKTEANISQAPRESGYATKSQ